jgi:hypothetical protein
MIPAVPLKTQWLVQSDSNLSNGDRNQNAVKMRWYMLAHGQCRKLPLKPKKKSGIDKVDGPTI